MMLDTMLDGLEELLTRSEVGKTWRIEKIAGYRVKAKVMGDTMPKLEIYDGDELVYHKSRSDVPLQKIPPASVQRIIARLKSTL